MKKYRDLSLKYKITILFFGTLFFCISITGSVLFYEGRKVAIDEFQYRGEEITRIASRLTFNLFKENNTVQILKIIQSIQDAKEVLVVAVYKQDESHWVEASGGDFPKPDLKKIRVEKNGISHKQINFEERKLYEYIQQISTQKGEHLGFIQVILDQSNLEKKLHMLLLKLITFCFIVLIFTTFISVKLLDYALQILPKLLASTVQISKGIYGETINIKAKDELGALAESVNKMSMKIKMTYNEVKMSSEFARLNPAPVLRITYDGVIMIANPSAHCFFADEYLKGKNISDIAPETKELDFRSLSNEGKILRAEIQNEEKVFIFVFCGLDTYDFIHAYSFDVTEIRIKDKQLVQSGKLAALGEMSSGIAHELNNPLHFIKGFNNRIKHKFEESHNLFFDDVSEYIHRIDENCNRMEVIINHFRDFSRQSDNKTEVVPINDTIYKSCTLLNEQLRLRGIKLNFKLAKEEVYINGDKNRLEQVFFNLISNSRDALDNISETKDPEILIRSSIEDNKVRIEFNDNGNGIEEKTLDKIFNPFFTTKDVGKGTGLGLSISHGIIKDHKGQITCESSLGNGTSFIIHLDSIQIKGAINAAS